MGSKKPTDRDILDKIGVDWEGTSKTPNNNRKFLDRPIEELAHELLEFAVKKKPLVRKWDSMSEVIRKFWENNGVVMDRQNRI